MDTIPTLVMKTGRFLPKEVWGSVIQFVYELNHRERMDAVFTELFLLVTWERKPPVFPLIWRRGRVESFTQGV